MFVFIGVGVSEVGWFYSLASLLFLYICIDNFVQ